jgi:hypothetical protein
MRVLRSWTNPHCGPPASHSPSHAPRRSGIPASKRLRGHHAIERHHHHEAFIRENQSEHSRDVDLCRAFDARCFSDRPQRQSKSTNYQRRRGQSGDRISHWPCKSGDPGATNQNAETGECHSPACHRRAFLGVLRDFIRLCAIPDRDHRKASRRQHEERDYPWQIRRHCHTDRHRE